MKKIKVLSIVGTRPELIRLSRVFAILMKLICGPPILLSIKKLTIIYFFFVIKNDSMNKPSIFVLNKHSIA